MDVFDSVKSGGKDIVSVRAYKGDAMTFLCFDLDESKLTDLTGFSIFVRFSNKKYFLFNRIRYAPAIIAKNNLGSKDLRSSEFSPFQKFNWVHVPATEHVTGKPFYGDYTYEVTPRYLVNEILQPIDPSLTVKVKIDLSPYKKGDLQIGFTRGFVSSQAYVEHFGHNGSVRPNDTDLIFPLSDNAGPVAGETIAGIKPYSFDEQFKWMGWQARERIYEFLKEVKDDASLKLDVFAYDLDEPQICRQLFDLKQQGRVRVILDNATLHHGKNAHGIDAFEDMFEAQYGDPSTLLRGRYSRYSHCKVLIQRRISDGTAVKVLTGSTNFSTNGLYVNANHVLIFSNPTVAQLYADVFDASFSNNDALMKKFKDNPLSKTGHDVNVAGTPDMTIRFSPHTAAFAAQEINDMADRVGHAASDVLFAVMNDTSGSGNLLKTIREIHVRDDIYTYGIVDTSSDVTLYKPGSKRGIRVAGKGLQPRLPPPFKEEQSIRGIAIHHKFVVVDFKGADPVVYCGSSNLAELAETQNGDNLIEIRDKDAATVFAIEAIRLVDHFHFRSKENQASASSEPFDLNTSTVKPWYGKFYDPNDLRCIGRLKFIAP